MRSRKAASAKGVRMSGYVKDREREKMKETVIVPGKAKQAEFAVSQWDRQIALNVRSICWRHWVTVSQETSGLSHQMAG